jgi:tetratricopeptide (TPR) repeat protein
MSVGRGGKRRATRDSRSARDHRGKEDHRAGKHRVASRRAAKRDQGPVHEQTLEEIFPPGHRFTDEEKAEASAIGVYMQNGLWKDAYKYSTKAGKQHPDRWWIQAARAAAAANVNRPKDTIEAVDQALQTNRGDANRLNLSQLYVLKANALSRLDRKSDAINTFLNAARINPKDPYSRAGAAWLYATAGDNRVRNGAQAVSLASEAARLSRERDATILDVLAASYAEQGNFRAARQWEEKAILAGAAADVPFYQRRLQSYQAARPWRERNA